MFIFSFFLGNASKSYVPVMEIVLPHYKLLDGKFPQHIPLFSTPPPTKNPPENASTLPNNHYYM